MDGDLIEETQEQMTSSVCNSSELICVGLSLLVELVYFVLDLLDLLIDSANIGVSLRNHGSVRVEFILLLLEFLEFVSQLRD